MLLLHVLNLDGKELAVGKTLLENNVGSLGVNVNLDDFLIVDNYYAVADGL